MGTTIHFAGRAVVLALAFGLCAWQAPASAQEATKGARQFDELKKKLPKIIDAEHKDVQGEFKTVRGRLEVARVYGPNEAKVTVTFQVESAVGSKSTRYLTIHMKYFGGKWTTADYHCGWSKSAGGEHPWQSIAMNAVALSIMLKIDKLAD